MVFWVNKKSFVSGIVDSSCEINVLSGGQNTKMTRWRVKIISLCLLCLISLMGCSFSEDKGDYMPYLKLKRGKTVNIEFSLGAHAGQTAEEAGQMMKDQKRCEDAWVNEEGRCVLKFNRDQLKAEYDKTVGDIKTAIKYAGKPVEVNYDCNEITYYVDDSTELMDFSYTHVVLVGECKLIQAYAGIPYDERELTIKFIYQPTGEVMFDLHISKDNPKASVEEEEFKEKLKEMQEKNERK